MSGAPLHDWLKPRMEALLRDAQAAGFERDVVVAVLIDLVTSPPFDPPERSEHVD
jgi:hypothetical protein